jgi:hypothetical protein
MTRFAVACVLACIPFATRADDPKPDVQKLKDEVELLEAKLMVHKAKVAGSEEMASIAKDFLARLKEAEQKGAAAHADLVVLMQAHARATADLRIHQAELKVAEVELNQAKRRLDAAGKVGGIAIEKKYTIRFENAKWEDVFAWFAKESGLVNAVVVKPTGTVTLKPREGKQFTLTEIVDLLNETMAPKFTLVRGEKSFTVRLADGVWPGK